MSDAVVELRATTKTFEDGAIVALDSVTLSVAPGEFVAITGTSGSGKTTLLNMMGAMDVPTSGRVLFGGVEARTRKALDRVRAERIGFIFQRHNLIPVLSARENVSVPLVPRGVTKEERRKRSLDWLEEVGLADRAASDVRVMSGGERQRIAIARALVTRPPLLLADEPTGNLDSRTGQEVMEALHAARARTNAALVLVTHDPAIAEGSDRHFELYDGQLAEA